MEQRENYYWTSLPPLGSQLIGSPKLLSLNTLKKYICIDATKFGRWYEAKGRIFLIPQTDEKFEEMKVAQRINSLF
jgi:hypothetical protein